MSIGAWQPLWIGSPSRRLYAALHGGSAEAGTGIVLVPPLLHEQPRSRRLLAETATALSAMGMPSLRFDFFGTGDSQGDGRESDFASMRADMDVAGQALRSHAGVQRTVVLSWRGASLVTASWLDNGGIADLAVYWEPIVEGAAWLHALDLADARERAARPRPRPGVPRTGQAEDGQRMGFAMSPRFRADLLGARLGEQVAATIPSWVVARPGAVDMPTSFERVHALPADTPSFDGGVSMEATFFLTPPLERVIATVGRQLRERTWQ